MTIRSILVANRGEIACRIIKTCKHMGIKTVAVFSDADRDAVFVSAADEAVYIGKSPAKESYLTIDTIIAVAKSQKVDAIHPGYGFLSENPEFATRCKESGIIFIGPPASAMALVGDKLAVKQMLEAHHTSIPLIPGYHGTDQSLSKLQKEAKRIGYPVLLKAAAGGGGKGMRVVHKHEDLEAALLSVTLEGKNSFGNDSILLEKYFSSVHHIEIQIFGDMHGNIVHFGERDCSVQRRHQKIIEETPSPFIPKTQVEAMGATAVAVGQIAKYVGAGTVEFLVDDKKNYYFLEVNTRLQVEHPITEMVQQLDLVQLQIEVAQGKTFYELGILLPSPSSDVKKSVPPRRRDPPSHAPKHALECRLYAEDPLNDFFPCIGKLLQFVPYEGVGVRFDSGVTSGSEVSVYYDPMIAKIITYGDSRLQSIQRMITTLKNTIVLGLTTNKKFLLQILEEEHFGLKGQFDTHYIENFFPIEKRKNYTLQIHNEQILVISLIGSLYKWSERRMKLKTLKHIPSGYSNGPIRFQTTKFTSQLSTTTPLICTAVQYKVKTKNFKRTCDAEEKNHVEFSGVVTLEADEKENKNKKQEKLNKTLDFNVILYGFPSKEGILKCEINGIYREYRIASGGSVGVREDENENHLHIHSSELGDFHLQVVPRFTNSMIDEVIDGKFVVKAPMPAKILKLHITENTEVKKGTLLIMIESMKMNMPLYASTDGVVNILVKEGQTVKEQTQLLIITQKQ